MQQLQFEEGNAQKQAFDPPMEFFFVALWMLFLLPKKDLFPSLFSPRRKFQSILFFWKGEGALHSQFSCIFFTGFLGGVGRERDRNNTLPPSTHPTHPKKGVKGMAGMVRTEAATVALTLTFLLPFPPLNPPAPPPPKKNG